MKKNRINAFTLVEMLIVIVIIGILIAALMPRMQAAQWRARDVSRKTALSQIQSAIVVSQWDKWKWPFQTCGTGDIWDGEKTYCAWSWIAVSVIEKDLKAAWMNSIPVDPLKWQVTWLWDFVGTSWGDYAYIVAKRNWTKNWWFALMAKTEVEWWSNRVVCGTGNNKVWYIGSDTDLAKDVTLCETITNTPNADCTNSWGKCSYKNDSELRYLLLY